MGIEEVHIFHHIGINNKYPQYIAFSLCQSVSYFDFAATEKENYDTLELILLLHS